MIFIDPHHPVEKVSFYLQFANSFYYEWVWYFINFFLSSIWDDFVTFLLYTMMCSWIDFFLQGWNIFIILAYTCYKLLNSVHWCFVEDFCLYAHVTYWSTSSSPSNDIVSFWYQDYVGLITPVGKSSLLCFWEKFVQCCCYWFCKWLIEFNSKLLWHGIIFVGFLFNKPNSLNIYRIIQICYFLFIKFYKIVVF